MTAESKSPKKAPTPASQAKIPSVGMPPRNPSSQHGGFKNFGSQWKWKWKWGPQVMRKHAARSR